MQAIGGFPLGILQGEDLLTWARLAARFQVAYCLRDTAVVWQPDFGSGQPTRRPEEEDCVAPALVCLLGEIAPPVRGSLLKYISLWHKMRGSMYLALGDRADARREFKRAMAYHARSAPLWAKYVMTFLPEAGIRRVLSLWLRLTRRPATA
jgi:hypothetical protein